MLTLDQIASDDKIKVFVYGDSGTGKTVLAAGFPGPIKYIDFEGKVNSAANFYRNKLEILKNIEVVQFKQHRDLAILNSYTAIGKEIENEVKAGKMKYKTIVFDSITEFSQLLLRDIILRNPTVKRPHADINAMSDYQLLGHYLRQALQGLLQLDCNIVVIGHLETEKDETTGAIACKPLLAGKNAAMIPRMFEEVYVSKVTDKGEYTLQTKSDSRHICRTQRSLPAVIKSSYEAIIGK